MILIYRPDGQEEQRWEFQPGKLRSAECEAIEKRTGMPYGSEFKEKLLQGNTAARRALLWTMLRRTHHTLRYDDVDFADEEVQIDFDRDEWQRLYDELKDNVGLTDEEREFRLAMVGAEIAKLDAEDAGEVGKAESNDSVTATA